MSDVKEEDHQLHIVIPKSLHNEIKAIMSGHGAVTALVRNFLKRYVSEHKAATSPMEKSPFDKAVVGLVNEDLMKRSE